MNSEPVFLLCLIKAISSMLVQDYHKGLTGNLKFFTPLIGQNPKELQSKLENDCNETEAVGYFSFTKYILISDSTFQFYLWTDEPGSFLTLRLMASNGDASKEYATSDFGINGNFSWYKVNITLAKDDDTFVDDLGLTAEINGIVDRFVPESKITNPNFWAIEIIARGRTLFQFLQTTVGCREMPRSSKSVSIPSWYLYIYCISASVLVIALAVALCAMHARHKKASAQSRVPGNYVSEMLDSTFGEGGKRTSFREKSASSHESVNSIYAISLENYDNHTCQQ